MPKRGEASTPVHPLPCITTHTPVGATPATHTRVFVQRAARLPLTPAWCMFFPPSINNISPSAHCKGSLQDRAMSEEIASNKCSPSKQSTWRSHFQMPPLWAALLNFLGVRVLFHLLLKHQLEPCQEQATALVDYSCTLWTILSSQIPGGTDTGT